MHERAGSCNVLHLHGGLNKVRSAGLGREVYPVSYNNPNINLGSFCPKGFPLRPHVVWIGEDVPQIESMIEIVKNVEFKSQTH